MFKMFSHYYCYHHYCWRTQIRKHIEPRKTNLLQTHPGELNFIEGFRPFQTPNSRFLFSCFFFHTGQVHQLNPLALMQTLPSMMAPSFATFSQALLIIEGGIFTSCFLILFSIIEGSVFAQWFVYLQLHGMYPKLFKFVKKRRILEADCDLQNGKIPTIKFPSPSSSRVVVAGKSSTFIDDLLFVSEKPKRIVFVGILSKTDSQKKGR